MRFAISAGHNPDGKTACGAVGIHKESTVTRGICEKVVKLLKWQGHVAYNCTVNDGASQKDVLRKVVEKSNKHYVDYAVSIHLNAGVNDLKGNGKTTGSEICYINGSCVPVAERILRYLSKSGLKNRGVKKRNGLYFLKKTNAKALLIECYFCDDNDDCNAATEWEIAIAIVSGLIDKDLRKRTVEKTVKLHAKPNALSKYKDIIVPNNDCECTEYAGRWVKVKFGSIVGWVDSKRLK